MFLSVFPVSSRVATLVIQGYVSNAAPWVYLLGVILFTVALIIEQNEVTARMLLTYTPLVMFSLYQQISLGVDAIRFVNPQWDEHRGPLYPTVWYDWFTLYDPHTLEEERQEEEDFSGLPSQD